MWFFVHNFSKRRCGMLSTVHNVIFFFDSKLPKKPPILNLQSLKFFSVLFPSLDNVGTVATFAHERIATGSLDIVCKHESPNIARIELFSAKVTPKHFSRFTHAPP